MDSGAVTDEPRRFDASGLPRERASFSKVVADVIAAVDAMLPARVAFVSNMDSESFEIVDAYDHEDMGFHAGLVLATPDTFCVRHITEEGAQYTGKASEDPVYRFAPARTAFGIETYCIAPIVLSDGTLYGTLCALDSRPDVEIGDSQLRVLQSLADLIARAYEEEQLVRGLRKEHAELREASAVRDEVVREIAHDLRAPLSAVQGFAELLTTRDLVDDRGQQYAGLIAKQSVRMRTMLEGLLDAESARAGGVADETPTDIELGELGTVLAYELSQLVNKGVEVHVDLTGRVRLPETRLHRLLLNLAANSARYTSEGMVSVVGSVDDGVATIVVADTGRGIPDDLLERLGEAGSKDADSPGFGLGLSIVLRFLKSMGGELSVHSEEGHGSTFELSIPSTVEGQPGGDAAE